MIGRGLCRLIVYDRVLPRRIQRLLRGRVSRPLDFLFHMVCVLQCLNRRLCIIVWMRFDPIIDLPRELFMVRLLPLYHCRSDGPLEPRRRGPIALRRTIHSNPLPTIHGGVHEACAREYLESALISSVVCDSCSLVSRRHVWGLGFRYNLIGLFGIRYDKLLATVTL